MYIIRKMSNASSKNIESFWLEDPIFFFLDTENYSKIIPDKTMTLSEQLNALFRFSIIFSLIILVIKHDLHSLLFALFGAIFTILIFKYAEKENKNKKGILEKMNIHEDKYAGNCTLPTKNNPFMNVLPTDIKDFPNRPPACNISNKNVRRKMNDAFSESVYKDVDDIYGRNTSHRQFYTMPSTTIPNDQKKFAEFLYVQNAPPGKM